jgi:hypothetical protein
MSFSLFVNRLPQEYQYLAHQEDSFYHAALSWLTVFKLDNVKNNTFMGSYEGSVRLHLIPYFGAMSMADISDVETRMYGEALIKLLLVCVNPITYPEAKVASGIFQYLTGFRLPNAKILAKLLKAEKSFFICFRN